MDSLHDAPERGGRGQGEASLQFVRKCLEGFIQPMIEKTDSSFHLQALSDDHAEMLRIICTEPTQVAVLSAVLSVDCDEMLDIPSGEEKLGTTRISEFDVKRPVTTINGTHFDGERILAWTNRFKDANNSCGMNVTHFDLVLSEGAVLVLRYVVQGLVLSYYLAPKL
jgi:hypothetical protein